MTIDLTSPRALLLQEAQALVCGDRNNQYGEPGQDFTRTAELWTVLLAEKLAPGQYISPADVALLMCALKLSRLTWAPEKRDSWVDLAGYAACGWDVASTGEVES